MAKWLDKYEQGGLVLKQKTKDNYGKKENANEGYSTAGPGWVGEGTTNRGFNYNGAWGGTMQNGGKAKAHKPTVKEISQMPDRREDSNLENVAEIFDPTGITSWDDVYRSYKETGASPQTAIEVLGALPLLGKASKLTKGGIHLAKYKGLDKALYNTLPKSTKASHALDAAGKLGRASDVYQAYDEFQNGGFLQPTSYKLPPAANEGAMSTEKATSIGGGPGEPAYLIPTFKYGKPLKDPEAEYRKTGEHLGGPFKTWQEAEKFGEMRHQYVEQGRNIPSPYKWWDEMQMGGSLPGATGMMYARTQDPAPSNGKYAKKTKASAQDGKEIMKGKEFVEQWMNSPKYNEMLSASAQGPELERISKGRIESFNVPTLVHKLEELRGTDTMGNQKLRVKNMFNATPSELEDMTKVLQYSINNPKDKEAKRKAKKVTDSEITGWEIGLNPVLEPGTADYEAVLAHEFGHNTGRPFMSKLPYEMSTKELMGQDRKPFIPVSDIEKMKKYSEGKINDNLTKYVSDPEETRQYINELRYLGKTQGVYDPFKEKITPEQYKKIKALKDTDPAETLRKVYTDDQIIDMLNSVSKNDSKTVTPQAQNGTEMPSAALTIDGPQLSSAIKSAKQNPTTKVATKAEIKKKKELTEEEYYNPKKPTYKSGNLAIDLLSSNPWLMKLPIVGDKIKDQAYALGVQHADARRTDEEIANPDKIDKLEGKYEGAFTNDFGEPFDLVKTYIYGNTGKDNIKLPNSPYTPKDDYYEFLPTYSLKERLGHPTNAGLKMSAIGKAPTSYKKDGEIFINDDGGAIDPETYKDLMEVVKTHKPVYYNSGIDEKNFKELRYGLFYNQGNPDLAHYKSGFGYDEDVNLPYAFLSDAWDFYPKDYGNFWDRSKQQDPKNTREYQQSYLMHKVGNPFKIYERTYIDPENKTLVSDREILDKKTKKKFTPAGLSKKVTEDLQNKVGKAYNPNMQNGGEMNFYQQGLDFTPKTISKNGSVIKDDMGQWAHPGEITEIDSNDITMEGVDYPVLGVSDTGDTKLMQPGENYKFKGKKVTEYPMMKKGGWLNKYK